MFLRTGKKKPIKPIKTKQEVTVHPLETLLKKLAKNKKKEDWSQDPGGGADEGLLKACAVLCCSQQPGSPGRKAEQDHPRCTASLDAGYPHPDGLSLEKQKGCTTQGVCLLACQQGYLDRGYWDAFFYFKSLQDHFSC